MPFNVKKISNLQKGIILSFGAAIISGLANFINKWGVSAVKDPFVYTTAKNLVTAVILIVILLLSVKFKKLKFISKKNWFKLLLIGVIGGGIPFLLYFKGLSLTSAPSASFIHKTMFIWVALLALPLLKEKLRFYQYPALLVLFTGNYLLVGLKAWHWGTGENLVLAATLMWALEFIMAKKILKDIGVEIVACSRMFFGVIFLIMFLFTTGRAAGLASFSFMQWQWALLAGGILALFVISWYAALKNAPVVLVTSILVIASPITTLLDEIFVKHQITYKNAIAALIIIAGIALLTLFVKKKIDRKDSIVIVNNT